MTDQYLSQRELQSLGFSDLGENISIHRSCNIVHPRKIAIASNVRIDGFSVISVSGNLTIGSYIHIGSFCYISGSADIVFDDFVNISQSVKLYSSSDDYSGRTMTNPMVPGEFKNVDSRPIRLGRHVLVGSGSIVLPGVDIGDGSSIGALSLVRSSLKPWGIYAGVPARFIKERERGVLELERRLLAAKASP